MNTIEEIIKNKKRKTLTEESIYETYKRVLCKECSNRGNSKDLCRITVTRDQKAKCYNYEKCMQRQCKTCKDNLRCEEQNNEI